MGSKIQGFLLDPLDPHLEVHTLPEGRHLSQFGHRMEY